jgi:Na+/H+ antiporter NhaD/arsenite permease-like protein
VRDLGLIAVTVASLALTPKAVHERNQFSWGPMQEVAKLFAGIFLTIIPVIAMLQGGRQRAFGAVVRAVTGSDGQPIPAMYFWVHGRAVSLPGQRADLPGVLQHRRRRPAAADDHAGQHAGGHQAGSVFMGANTYIGNAPNFMVKAIAEDRGVRMPSFFGYMAWSVGILVPLFIVLTLVFFR